ncbi:MAG: TetR/AcrR family transcriptional regulator [Pseudomonadota bacterium]|nr:TetR/AcrR family transcriptional regulator [Pseudomonadota bacterium]
MPTNKTKKRSPARPRVRRGNQEDADGMRADLLAAAARLFEEGGLDAVSVRAVAARVGVSAMTPYRYFADKSELLAGLMSAVFDATAERMRQAVAGQRGARERLRASLDAYFGYWEDHPDHYRLVYMTEQNTRPATGTGNDSVRIYEQVISESTQLCSQLAEEIGASTANIRLACDVRRAMALGYLYAMQVNRRYPWSETALLRPAYIEQTVQAMERCLLDGPPHMAAASLAVRPVAADRL